MKFLTWCVGVMQILTGLTLAWTIAPAWRWVWISLAVFWIFAGALAGVLALVKLAAAKVGAGGLAALRQASPRAPAPQSKE